MSDIQNLKPHEKMTRLNAKSAYIGLRLSLKMKDILNELASKNQRSVSGQIRILLADALLGK